MYTAVDDMMKALPEEYSGILLPAIRQEFIKSGKTIVVLDDDPTGTQTCYDVIVLTAWRVPLIVAELKKKPSILFILTNSRSLPEKAAVHLAMEIGMNLLEAVKESGRDIVVISRSDSTLRGHFPAEVDTVANALDMTDAVRVLIPAFIEGGRFTINDIHYIREENLLIPVADTPFAKDLAFGYSHSNLKEWVNEKTKGRVPSNEVVSISLHDLRLGGPEAVSERLTKCLPGQVCIANACSLKDLEVLVMGLLLAEKSRIKFLYRTSATFISIRAGISPGKFFTPESENTKPANGSLVVVGSYVPKTTRQLIYLMKQGSHKPIEIHVSDLLNVKDHSDYRDRVILETEQWITSGNDVVIYTSRDLQVGIDAESSLEINGVVSAFLVSVISRLKARPAFMVAKGGITSSDIVTKALKAEKALILGQIIPGVPVWRIDSESKFPDILFVVFPGNVGDDLALAEVCNRFKF